MSVPTEVVQMKPLSISPALGGGCGIETDGEPFPLSGAGIQVNLESIQQSPLAQCE